MCPSADRLWSRLAMRLPWVSIAARGAPAVPLVNISTARCEVSTSTGASGSDDVTRSSKPTVPSVDLGVDHGLDGRQQRRLDVRPVDGAHLVDDDHFRADHRKLRFEFRCGAGGVERDGHRAEADGGQVPDHEVRRVGEQQRHAVTRLDAERHQATTEALDLIAEFAVGRRPPSPDQRGGVAGVVVDDVREIHVSPCGCGRGFTPGASVLLDAGACVVLDVPSEPDGNVRQAGQDRRSLAA